MMRSDRLRPAIVAAALVVGGLAVSGPARGADKQYTIGYSVATLANPFFQGMTKGVVDAVKAHPDLTLVNTSAQGDANTQATQIQDLINRKVDALVINPINADAIVPIVKRANKAGIPVFTLDRGAACGDCQVNFLETNNVELGKEGADFIAAQLKKRYGSVKGNVVDLEGLLGTTAGDAREAGFTKEMQTLGKTNPGLKIVARQEGAFDSEKSFNAMTQIMTANPQIDAVLNGNDDNAVGAMRAIRQANRFAPIGNPKHNRRHRNRWHGASLDRHPARLARRDTFTESAYDGREVGELCRAISPRAEIGYSASCVLAAPPFDQSQHRQPASQGIRALGRRR